MNDLNDLYIFSQVVEHNSFTAAARAMGIARSSICRRIAQLEERLGVRLVQRTTRHFAVTDLGKEFYQDCVKMVAEAQAAYERVACARGKPSGMIRMSCSTGLAQLLVAPLIPQFSEKNPEVRIALEATDRKIDIDENFDLSIRVRHTPAEDSQMVMRSLAIVPQVLVASPAFLDRHGRPKSIAQASKLATLSYGPAQGPHIWRLIDAEGREAQLRHEPKLISDDVALIRQTAVQGLGVVQLPICVVLAELRQELLEVVLPESATPVCDIQLLFPSRRGMLPAVRCFIDFLTAHCAKQIEGWQMSSQAGRAGENVRLFAGGRQRVA